MGLGKTIVKGPVIFIISLLVVIKLVGQENTYKELKDGVVYTRNAPFAILVEGNENIKSSYWTETIRHPIEYLQNYTSDNIKDFYDYWETRTTVITQDEVYPNIFYKRCFYMDKWYLFYICEGAFCIVDLQSEMYTDLRGIDENVNMYVLPSFIEQIFQIPYEYILFENGKYYKIYPRIVLQKKKELNVNDVAVILNSIKKTYKHISSKIEFKFYGDYGGYLNIPFVSSYTQDPMLQFKYLKNCIERGDEKIELELLYPQTFQFWTNLFIESGLFSSVYLKTDELNLTNGKDGK